LTHEFLHACPDHGGAHSLGVHAAANLRKAQGAVPIPCVGGEDPLNFQERAQTWVGIVGRARNLQGHVHLCVDARISAYWSVSWLGKPRFGPHHTCREPLFAPPRFLRMARNPAIWTGPPVPPVPPAPSAAPEPKRPSRTWAFVVAGIVAGGVLGALIMFAVQPSQEECGVDCVWRSRFDYRMPVIVLNYHDYRQYIDVHVRPTLVAVSVSITSAACQSLTANPTPQGAAQDLLQPLQEARTVAEKALQDARRVVPPQTLQVFHDRYKGVLATTVEAVDAIEDCSKGGSCDRAADKVLGLTQASQGLFDEVRKIAL
jgi:hypothetical protein